MLFRSARSGQNLAVDLVTGIAGSDAHDDARDRIVRLRLAAADRILAVGDLRARIAQLGREFIAPLRIETSRLIVRLGAAGEEGVEPGDARAAAAAADIVGAGRAFVESLIGPLDAVVVVDLLVEAADIAVVREGTAADQRAPSSAQGHGPP